MLKSGPLRPFVFVGPSLLKAALTVCGDKKRLCAEIDTSAPEYGKRGQFRILKG
ncbi:hypothetical protein GHO26_25060, partial [Pseudomonas helleri]|nr:hypothetical protein [Pseudomonas helleri]